MSTDENETSVDQQLNTQDKSLEENDNKTSENDLSQNKSPEELLEKGKELLRNEDYEGSASTLSLALQKMVEKNSQNPRSIELVDFYLFYGKALLRLTQNQNDIFEPIKKKKNESEKDEDKEHEHEEEEQEEEQEEEEKAQEDRTSENKISESCDENKDISIENHGNCDAECKKVENQESNENSSANNKEQNKNEDEDRNENENEDDQDEDDQEEDEHDEGEQAPDVDTTEDRELAWESLETSRVIIEDYLQLTNPNQSDKNVDKNFKKYVLILAEVYCLLAESQMEEEKFEEALGDFQKALEFRKMCEDSLRQLAYTHFMSSICASYANKKDVSKQHLKDSVYILRQCVFEILKSFPVEYQNVEMTNEELLEKIDKCLETETLTKETKDELNDLKNNILDLMRKMNEEENSNTNENDEKDLLNDVIQKMLSRNQENNETIKEESDVDLEIEQENIPFDNNRNLSHPENESNGKDGKKNNEIDTWPMMPLGHGDDCSISMTTDDGKIVNNLGSFGSRNSKKRSLEQAEINEINPETKKIKLTLTERDENQ